MREATEAFSPGAAAVAEAVPAAGVGASAEAVPAAPVVPVPAFRRTEGLTGRPFHYCPGCTHGVAHRLVAEVLEELGVLGRTVGIASVGCSVLAYEYFNCDMQQAAHGRAPAVATGVKRARPDCVVFTYQGDGDLASIGLGELIHAAARGENVTVVFLNNAVFGMTGGQMAPTTVAGMVTTTTPAGRRPAGEGFPIRVPEMLAALEGPAYLARGSLHNPAGVLRARKYLRRAFEVQLAGRGFSLVELLSTCYVGWRCSPTEALTLLAERLLPQFPVGELRVPAEEGAAAAGGTA